MDKAWLQRYPSVPVEITSDQSLTLVDMFENAEKYSDQVVFINMGQVTTFRKLKSEAVLLQLICKMN